MCAGDVSKDMDTASLGRGDGPVVRHNHALVFVAAGHDVPGVDNGDILLVIGGSTHWAYLGDVWVFDLKTGSWTQMIPGGPGPVARHGHVAALVGSTVVVFGGHSGMQSRPSTLTYYNDVFSLDLTSWSWTRCATTLSTPRSWMGVAVVGALVVVAGGYTFDVTARDEVYFDVIEAYDVANDVFLSLPPDVTLASPRNRVCMASCASTIVIFGGNALLADRGDVFFSDIAVLDASSTCVSNWTLSVASPPTPPLKGRGHGLMLIAPAASTSSGAMAPLHVTVWGGERAGARLFDTLDLVLSPHPI